MMNDKLSKIERLQSELREYAIASAYLFVCFMVILMFRSAVLGGSGFSAVPVGFAAAKALILGKFLLIGEAAGVGSHLRSRTLLQHTLRKSMLLFVTLIVLTIIEELIVGWFHGSSVAGTLDARQRHSPMEILATSLLMMMVLIPYVSVKELSRALGPGVFHRMLFASAQQSATGESQSGHDAKD
jgi:hypothetical protein